MTAKEYLSQAYYLDVRIKSDLDELSELRKMVSRISAPNLEPNYNPNHSSEAPFVKELEAVWRLEEKIHTEIDNLSSIKATIHEVIDEVEEHDRQMLLRYRYVHLDSWETIAAKMHYSNRWVHTLHGRALRSAEVILKRRGLI